MSLAAKRRFLTEFWKRRDPTAGTAENERREQFYQAIAYADANYKEPGKRAADGWRTDRGRIYAKNGTPDDVLRAAQGSLRRRRTRSGSTPGARRATTSLPTGPGSGPFS